jgi:hypothetical protein
MCPFCFLQTVTLVSGTISACGLGTYLVRKAQAWDRGRGTEAQADASDVNKSDPSIGTTVRAVGMVGDGDRT